MIVIFLLSVAYGDAIERRIDNHCVIIIFLLSVLLSSGSANTLYRLDSIIICCLIGFIFHMCNVWGGGDGKLLIAVAPLFPLAQLLDFFVATLLCGGFLSIFYWVKYRFLFKDAQDEGLPYGIAIVCGVNLSLYFSQGLAIYS